MSLRLGTEEYHRGEWRPPIAGLTESEFNVRAVSSSSLLPGPRFQRYDRFEKTFINTLESLVRSLGGKKRLSELTYSSLDAGSSGLEMGNTRMIDEEVAVAMTMAHAERVRRRRVNDT